MRVLPPFAALQKKGTIRLDTGEKIYVYLDKQGYPRLRPMGGGHRPKQPTISAFRVVLWAAWGAPKGRRLACHMACDCHGCINPLHGRWGSSADNRKEARLLAAWRDVSTRMTTAQQAAWANEHPALQAHKLQGFP